MKIYSGCETLCSSDWKKNDFTLRKTRENRAEDLEKLWHKRGIWDYNICDTRSFKIIYVEKTVRTSGRLWHKQNIWEIPFWDTDIYQISCFTNTIVIALMPLHYYSRSLVDLEVELAAKRAELQCLSQEANLLRESIADALREKEILFVKYQKIQDFKEIAVRKQTVLFYSYCLHRKQFF